MDHQTPKLLIATTVAATLEAFLLPYATYFRKKGWTVDCVASDASQSPACSEHFDGVHDIPWTRSPLDFQNLTIAAPQIADLVQRNGYDIVHVHTPVAAFTTRYALRNRRKWEKKPSVVYTAHGFHFYKGGNFLRNTIFKTLEKKAAQWTDKLIVINQEDYEAALTNHFLPQEDIIYMPGIGLDLEKYSPNPVMQESALKIRSELGINSHDTLFTLIAEFNPGKRHRDALQALALTENKHLHLAFAGNGPLRHEMIDLSKTLKIENQVHFLGFRNDIIALILASKATLLPSEREGLPRSVMESICLGVPVIGADARGIRDIITDDNGIIFPVGDVAALSEALKKCVNISYHRITPNPSWDLVNRIREHKNLYEGIFKPNIVEASIS